MKLTEDAIRAKVIWLLDKCDGVRMELWTSTAVGVGLVDVEVLERIMLEELPRRAPEVQTWWLEPCNCHGELN